MKYVSDFIPNSNVEIFVSIDQESIAAAYTVFPKDEDKDIRRKIRTVIITNTYLSDVELFNKDFMNC